MVKYLDLIEIMNSIIDLNYNTPAKFGVLKYTTQHYQ